MAAQGLAHKDLFNESVLDNVDYITVADLVVTNSMDVSGIEMTGLAATMIAGKGVSNANFNWLVGQDQFVHSTSDPTFNSVTITSSFAVTDNGFVIEDENNDTIKMKFDCTANTPGQTRVLSAQDKSYTIADKTDTDTNATNIATNTSNISTNTTNIATNTSNISTNTTAIANIGVDLEVEDDTFRIYRTTDNTRKVKFVISSMGMDTGETYEVRLPSLNTGYTYGTIPFPENPSGFTFEGNICISDAAGLCVDQLTQWSASHGINFTDWINVDTIKEYSSAAGVTIDSVLLKDNSVTCATIDTGQGAVECYAMDQAVQTTDSPSFANVTSTGYVQTDTIQENGAGSGVTIDSVLLKDNTITCATINTGQGQVECYPMDQDCRMAATVTHTYVVATSGVNTNSIVEYTAGSGVTCENVLLKDGEVSTDTINEKTGGSGVTIDSVLIKDNTVTTSSGTSTFGTIKLINQNCLDANSAQAMNIGQTNANAVNVYPEFFPLAGVHQPCALWMRMNNSLVVNATTFTTLDFDTGVYGDTSDWDTSNYWFEPPFDGWYKVEIQLRFTSAIAGNYYRVYYKNGASGSTYDGLMEIAGAQATTYPHYTFVLRCSTTDDLPFIIYAQDAINVSGGGSYHLAKMKIVLLSTY